MRRDAMVLVLAWLSLPLLAAAADSGAPASRQEAARGFLRLLEAGRFDEAVGRFDETMSGALPAAKLRQVWEGLQGQVGAFEEQAGARSERSGAFDVVLVACRFGGSWLDAKIVFDAQGKIAGLFFVPGRPPADEPEAERPPPGGVKQEEVVVGEGEWELPGTLTLPPGAGPFPAVVMVHGSGPHDRDETIGPNKPFRDLAHGLAAAGVASLRYDKRTLHHRERMASAMQGLTVKQETVDDALAAVAYLRGRDSIRGDRIFVLGHSLGGALAPRIGARDPGIAGLVILAGHTRPLEDLMLEQMRYIAGLDGEVSDEERARIDAVAAERERIRGAGLQAMGDDELVLGVPASYWKDLRRYRPAEAAAALDRPMLILQGRRDYQVTVEDLEGWRRVLGARDDVLFRVYPELNHLFMKGEGKSSPREYQAAGRVADEVIRDIAAWIRRGADGAG